MAAGCCQVCHCICVVLIFGDCCVFSCYRRSGQLQRALELYKAIHAKEPDNIECTLLLFPSVLLHSVAFSVFFAGLKFLCLICKDLNEMQQYEEYSRLLKQAEREHEKNKSGYMKNEGQFQTGAPCRFDF